MKARRDELRAAKRCINGPMEGTRGAGGIEHGPPVSGGKCARCVEVHDGPRPTNPGITVPCPVCSSRAGVQCRSRYGAGPFTRMHAERVAAATAKETPCPTSNPPSV
jgi:hypothetical protein